MSRSTACSSTDPKRTLIASRGTIVLSNVTEDVTLDKDVDVVLVSEEDVVVTLPYQPAPGKVIIVATRSAGTTVEPGCAPDCNCDDDEDACDTLCNEEESFAVTECEQVMFTYFPGDACADTPVEGTWTTGTGPTGPTGA